MRRLAWANRPIVHLAGWLAVRTIQYEGQLVPVKATFVTERPSRILQNKDPFYGQRWGDFMIRFGTEIRNHKYVEHRRNRRRDDMCDHRKHLPPRDQFSNV